MDACPAHNVRMTPTRFRKHLERLGLTHAAFAAVVRVDRATVTKWANGTHPIPYLVQEKIESMEPESESKAVKA